MKKISLKKLSLNKKVISEMDAFSAIGGIRKDEHTKRFGDPKSCLGGCSGGCSNVCPPPPPK